MPIVFIDNEDHAGRITDAFSVDYVGRLAVEEYVRGIEAETASTEEAIEELIIGPVQDLDVEEAWRAESAVPPARS